MTRWIPSAAAGACFLLAPACSTGTNPVDAAQEPKQAAAPGTTSTHDAGPARANEPNFARPARPSQLDAGVLATDDESQVTSLSDAGPGSLTIATDASSEADAAGMSPVATDAAATTPVATEPFTLEVSDAARDGRNVVVQLRTDGPVWARYCARAEVIPMEPDELGYVELVREMDYGPWYIDGEYEPRDANLGCDVHGCIPLTEFRFTVDRVEEVGRAPRPPDERAGAPLSDVANVTDGGVVAHTDGGIDNWVPVYESRILSGHVNVRYRYYRGETCDGDPSLFAQQLDLDVIE